MAGVQNISKLKLAYLKSKNARVGMDCICPSCQTQFFKTHSQQAFCKTKSGTKCKDRYWNTVTPDKRCNTTRISPANARYYAEVIEPNLNANYDNDQSWDAHKDSF